MRIALVQLNYIIGDFEHNTSKIIDAILTCKNQNADLVVFAELSVCGYPPRDFLEFDDFVEKCYAAIGSIAKSCHGIAAIVGAPSRNPYLKGKNLFNSAWLLENGKIQSLTHKALLPNYDIFDEYRYFEPNRAVQCIRFKDATIALTICEDIWNLGPDPLYVANPMETLSLENPGLMINIAASPFNYNQVRQRDEILKSNVRQYSIPIIYVNQVGAQTELLFDGNSVALDKDQTMVANCKSFEEDITLVDFENGSLTALKVPEAFPSDKTHLIHDALVMGIRDYFSKMGFKKAIL